MRKQWLWMIGLLVGMIVAGMGVVQAGGWAVLTLHRLPQNVVAGEAFTVRYSTRQHGNHLVPGLNSFVTAVHAETGETLKFEAQAAEEAGYYEASIVLPAAGEWRWKIEAFGTHTMPPLTVIDKATAAASAASAGVADIAASPWQMAGLAALAGGVVLFLIGWRRPSRLLQGTAVAAVAAGLVLGFAASARPAETAVAQQEMHASAAEQGAALFVAKGCVSCHRNDNITYARTTVELGPDLTKYQGSPEFMRLWLQNPAQVRPQTEMPDLELATDEIEALIAFLTAESDG